MGFDIPMSTKGAMDSSSLLSLNGGGTGAQAPQAPQNPVGSMDYNQQNNMGGYSQQAPVQQNFNQQAPMQQNFNQQAPVQQNFNQQAPMQQNFNQQAPMQQNFNQQAPMQQNFNQQAPMQQNFNQQAPMQQIIGQPKQRPVGNGVRLKKGQKFGLAGSNGAPMLNLKVALGWDILNQQCDLDSSAFMLGANGKVLGDEWFVFYGSTTSPDGSVIHSGDSSGAGDDDDEVISVSLQRINQQVEKIVFVVTINEALEMGLNFSMVANAYIRILNADTNQEIARFDLTNYYSNVTSMMVGELYKRNGEWKFNPIGDGISADLMGLCERYGVNVAD